MILLHVTQHLTDVVQYLAPHLHTLGGPPHVPGADSPGPYSTPGAGLNPPDPPSPSSGGQLTDLSNLLGAVRNAIFYLGITTFLIGVTVAGIMRVASFGNERRIAMSNMALTAAVAGLVIMLLAQGLYSFIYGAFFHS